MEEDKRWDDDGIIGAVGEEGGDEAANARKPLADLMRGEMVGVNCDFSAVIEVQVIFFIVCVVVVVVVVVVESSPTPSFHAWPIVMVHPCCTTTPLTPHVACCVCVCLYVFNNSCRRAHSGRPSRRPSATRWCSQWSASYRCASSAAGYVCMYCVFFLCL